MLHNSARSQMAEGMLRAWGGDRFEVSSAGIEASIVRPEAIAVMDEVGIDISSQTSKSVGRFLGESFGWLITVCDEANEACPTIPGVRQLAHWSIDDPAKVEGDEAKRLDAFRTARDTLRDRVHIFMLAAEREDLPHPEPERIGGTSPADRLRGVSRAVPVCPHCATPSEEPLVCDRCGWRWHRNPSPPPPCSSSDPPGPGWSPRSSSCVARWSPGSAWDLPAGYLDPGESFEQAARRETRGGGRARGRSDGLVRRLPLAVRERGHRRVPGPPGRAGRADPAGRRVERARMGIALGDRRLAAADGVPVDGRGGVGLGVRSMGGPSPDDA